MKFLLALTAAALLATGTSSLCAADVPFFKKGDVLIVQTEAPLPDSPKDVTVVDFGPGTWVLVEYDRTFSKAGESGLKTEKAQMWINFGHVIAAKVVPAKK